MQRNAMQKGPAAPQKQKPMAPLPLAEPQEEKQPRPERGEENSRPLEVTSGLLQWVRPHGAWSQNKSTLPSWAPMCVCKSTPKLEVRHRAVDTPRAQRVFAGVGSGAPKLSTGQSAEASPPGGRVAGQRAGAGLADREPPDTSQTGR